MTPPELTRLRERLAEITDLQALGALMFWDQNTMMPPGGAAAPGRAGIQRSKAA